ncbi:hypothetical protein BJP34_32990 [Moorena producens PAL-8-15-08-1]|uniref:Uncharacterized protein n=1 Tax=Moorena producens PAL-8-15-08-1 TaxID=1458985 RepID=A0A1D8U1P4_9CYAN|nr:hypothetical protein [Moorena producens]AOX03606.1 hypothetical protein BJP34_32990 [Moorena producens PAL-8-15-08-1]
MVYKSIYQLQDNRLFKPKNKTNQLLVINLTSSLVLSLSFFSIKYLLFGLLPSSLFMKNINQSTTPNYNNEFIVKNKIFAAHPTSIPWINDSYNCEATGRAWEQGECWDYEHNHNW